jgi:hypothetical protein
MLIEILRQTSIKGIPARVGELIDVSDADGRYLVGNGKAKEAETQPVEMACPMPEARKPRPRKFTPA